MVGDLLAPIGERAFILTDSTVAEILLEPLLHALSRGRIESTSSVLSPGESTKTLEVAGEIYRFLAENCVERSDVIIALGGGVIGDLAGFVASTFKRGMRLVQIPTTLLSQVDSALGGKTGLNLEYGKNLVGTYYQPHAIVADVCFLETLPEEQFKSGLAEIIKYALSMDNGLTDILLSNQKEILSREPEIMALIVERCLRNKARVVEKDEREEKNHRQILNYGHTIGHAVEVCLGYSLPHGLAVSIGIAEEARCAARLGLLDTESVETVIDILSAFDLPASIPQKVTREKMVQVLQQDKKMCRGMVMLPLLVELGRTKMTTINPEQILNFDIEE
jgi:3-dehydroquinate synthase